MGEGLIILPPSQLIEVMDNDKRTVQTCIESLCDHSRLTENWSQRKESNSNGTRYDIENREEMNKTRKTPEHRSPFAQ